MDTKFEITNLRHWLNRLFSFAESQAIGFLKLGLAEYFEDQIQKHLHVNNFLYRGKKVNFFEFYFPIKASYQNASTDFNSPTVVFEENRFILIIGDAGSGKSTLTKYIFLQSILEQYKIPILVELRHLNILDKELLTFLREKLASFSMKSTDELITSSLKKGLYLFILDGYDEVYSKRRLSLDLQLEQMLDKYPRNTFLVTTRPGAGLDYSSRFRRFSINPLDKIDIKAFVDQQVENVERKKRLKKIIGSSQGKVYEGYLKSPLLLSMFILAFEKHPEIPRRKSAFYRNVFDTLYSQHDGITKGSFPRERQSQLSKYEFEEILETFCFLSFVKEQFSFTKQNLEDLLSQIKKTRPKFSYDVEALIHDLRTSIGVLLKDGFEYRFLHRSLQEYFAAVFISKLDVKQQDKIYSAPYWPKLYVHDMFWRLNLEINPYSFKKYFLIRQLKSIHNDFRPISKEYVLRTFLKTFSFGGDYFEVTSDSDNLDFLFGVIGDQITSLLEVCGITVHEVLADSYTEEERDQIARLEPGLEFSYEFRKLPEKYSDIFKVLVDSKLPERIIELYKLIEMKMLEYQREIEEEETSLDKLLDL